MTKTGMTLAPLVRVIGNLKPEARYWLGKQGLALCRGFMKALWLGMRSYVWQTLKLERQLMKER